MPRILLLCSVLFLIRCGTNEPQNPEQIDQESQKTKEAEFQQKRWRDANGTKLESLSWLFGKWADTTTFAARRAQIHAWWSLEDSTIRCKRFGVERGDTSRSEYRLLERGDKIVLKHNVQSRYDGKMITYDLVSIGENMAKFENMLYEFPQTMTYKRTISDSLVIELIGISPNGPATKVLRMFKY